MDFDLGDRAAELRTTLRSMIERELPAGFLGAFTNDPADLAVTQRFCKRLAEDNLLTWAWPVEYGGRGGTMWDQTVIREEMWAHHEPRGAQYMGLNWVGPAVMAFGTDEQKAFHLSAIGAGDVVWCQGFSEPDAGSDLASLKTRADAAPDGNGWRINGQKIWTSYAEMAQFCVLAARTSTGARKHEGITLFLLPMDRAGITVQPIKSMLGRHHLNEVFFEDVEVYENEVLGAVGDGWRVIRHALTFERVGIARYARCERLLSLLESELVASGEEMSANVRALFMRALIHTRVARLLAYRVVHQQEIGALNDADASAARIAVTQCDQFVAEMLFQAIESDSLRDAKSGAPIYGAIEDHWRYAQAATIASGTIEIQRQLVARSALGGSR